MNWLNLAKGLFKSKKGREKTGGIIKGILLGILLILFVSAAVVTLLFNIFICTISFGTIGGCDEGNKEIHQIVKEEEFEELGEKMKELRTKTNEEVDVPGQDYGEYKSVINDMMINEAEVHIRALYQLDYFAIQGIDDTEEDVIKKFGALEGNKKRFVEIWKMAKQMEKEEKEKSAWWKARSDEYDFVTRDWMMAVQMEAYRCFYIGDEKSAWYKPTTWFSTDTPCQDLDDLYERATGESKQVVHSDFRGVIAHKHIITQETWMCSGGDGGGTAFLDFFKPNVAYAHHLDRTIPRGDPPDCGEGTAEPGPDIKTSYATYENLMDMVYAFEQFSLFIPGETVSTEDDYKEMVSYILRELYAMYFGDSSLVPLPGMTPSTGWLIPMQEGTYYLSSPFGWRNLGGLDFHYGVDLATHKTQKVPIYATKGGTVMFANPSSASPVGAASGGDNRVVSGCEGYISVQHDDGTSAAYCHMFREDILVKKGQRIVQGQLIAGVGNGGASTGHHLDIKLCETYTGPFGCKNGNKNPEGINVDYFNPEGEPSNWVLNKDTGKATSANIAKAVDYFKEVSNKLKNTSSANREAEAQKFLMPGFTPAGIGMGGVFGQLPWKYESGFGSPSTCSSGVGDLGGISCGTHQLSKDSQKTFVKWLQSKGTAPYSTYYNALSGIPTGTTQFASTWKAIGDKNEMEFFSIQEEYFSTAYLGPMINNWQKWFGVDLRTQNKAVIEAVYSLSIQHGSNSKIPQKVLDAKSYASYTPAEIITKLYHERSRSSNGTMVYFSGSSKGVQKSVYNRLRYNELCDALWLAANPDGDLRSAQTGCVVQNRAIGQ